MTPPPGNRCFFLGGYDLEMVAIRDLLHARGQRVVDHRLAWGAKASAYGTEIAEQVAAGVTPILIELQPDILLPDRTLRIDHHGPLAGADRPTSLEQVFALLKLPASAWTRRFDLIAANDRGHVRAMLALSPPATIAEMTAIRRADRIAQGITAAEEEQGEAAAANAETLAEGRLTVVQLPHGRTATVADRLDAALGGPGYGTPAVFSPDQVNVFAAGWLIRRLAERWVDGWYGGNLPDRGFWGGKPAPAKLKRFLLQSLAACP